MNKGMYIALTNAELISQMWPDKGLPVHKPDCRECAEVKEVLESFERQGKEPR